MCGAPKAEAGILSANGVPTTRGFLAPPPERLPLGSPLTLWASLALRAVKEAPQDEADSVRKTLRGAKAKKRPEMRRILSGSLLGGGAKDRLNPRRF